MRTKMKISKPKITAGFLLFIFSSVYGQALPLEKQEVYSLEEMVVEPEKDDGLQTGFTSFKISGEGLKALPQNFFADISTGLSSFPGIVKMEKFSGELYVRGGKPYELLHVLNGVPLFNPYKWGNALLLYNQDIVDTAELYPGGFSAKYPQAASGVLEVNYKEGSKEKFEGEFKLGAETSLHWEGPLLKGSFLLSYRRTFYDLFINEKSGKGDKMEYPSFEDFYFSTAQQLTDTDTLSLWMYDSIEGMKVVFKDLEDDDEEAQEMWTDDDKMDYSSRTSIFTADWKHFFSEDAYIRTVYSKNINNLKNVSLDTFLVDAEVAEETEFDTLILEYGMTLGNHQFRVGGGSVNFDTTEYKSNIHVYLPDPTETYMVEKTFVENMSDLKKDGYYKGKIQYGYLEDKMDFGPVSLAPGCNYVYTDLVEKNREVIDPRVTLTYTLENETRLKFSTGQYSMHGLSYFHREDSPELKPEKSIHYITGLEKDINENYRLRVEGYYKDLKNLIVSDPEDKNREESGEYEYLYDNRGTGFSKGVELFLQKKKTKESKVDGWLSYSYSITRCNDHSVENPEEYYPLHDQRHTLSLVGNYYFFKNDRHELFLNGFLSYHTGRWYEDFEVAEIQLKDKTIYVERNLNRYKKLPDYYNLDLSLEYVKKYKTWDLHTFFQILNATDHKNLVGYYVPTFKNKKAEYTDMGMTPTVGIKIGF